MNKPPINPFQIPQQPLRHEPQDDGEHHERKVYEGDGQAEVFHAFSIQRLQNRAIAMFAARDAGTITPSTSGV